MKLFNNVVLGGTFDRLHDGHKKLFYVAATLGNKVIIGLTIEKLLVFKKFLERINSYKTREGNLKNYFGEFHPEINLTITPIENIQGNLLDKTTADIDAIIISSEHVVINNTIEINKRRLEVGLRELAIIIIPLVKGGDGERLSSTKMRGEVG